MNLPWNLAARAAFLLAVPVLQSQAAVQFISITPSQKQPQVIGTSITWTVKANDGTSGRPMFQFSVAAPRQAFSIVKDFNAGTSRGGVWTAQPFVWVPTGSEGLYQIRIVAKDFASNSSVSKTVKYEITALVTTGGAPVVKATSNPLVALFSAPSCASGSLMRVSFQEQSGSTPATTTNWKPCDPPFTMTFEIGGMYSNTPYNLFAQTRTGSTTVNGLPVTFTTGLLPTSVPFPAVTIETPAGPNADTTDSLLYLGVGRDTSFANIATDLNGKVMWYYYSNDSSHRDLLTHPLPNGNLLAIEDGLVWNPTEQKSQLVREVDLAGNVLHETNTGIIQQELLVKGAMNAGPCATIAKPAPVGAACLGSFHHDFIQSLPDGGSAVIADIEKIYPAGTQGDTSGLPVDIIGDILIVLDKNWQVSWYFDAFDHLDITRTAILGETCTVNKGGCPPVFLLGSGIAPDAHDWLHANSVYYWPQTKDLIWSSRHQDWIYKVDYNNGAGTGNVLWTMGPNSDFTINSSDTVWPWFSHQHHVSIQGGGSGPLSLFDNGNTRLSQLGNNCGPSDCNSRGMMLNFDESTMQVTPMISVDLGQFSTALGSAQLLSNGNSLFLAGLVLPTPTRPVSYTIQIYPTSGTTTGTQVFNMKGPEEYRAWQMPSLYNPPTT